jgi:single-strand DNA-binding protein
MADEQVKIPAINNIQIAGRLTRDPEVKQIPTGTTLTQFGVAVNDGYGDKQKTYFFNVKMWGDVGERVANEVKKGYPVIVDGKMTIESWDKDGQTVTVPQIVAFRCQSLRWANQGADSDRGAGVPGGGNYQNNTGVSEPIPEDDIPF